MHHVHRNQFLVEMSPLLGRIGRAVEHYFPLFLHYDTVICVSKSTADDMKKYLMGVDNLPLEVINNGIDHSFFSPGNERFDHPTILYLGRIKKYKQLDRLISLMPKIKEEISDIQLLIAGKGDYLDNLTAQVAQEGLGDYVKLLGHVSEEEKRDLYRKAWVLAMPSMNEGWGMNVIEANTCGTPCVAYKVPGLKDSVVHGRSGFLAEDDDQFVRYLVSIVQDPTLRDTLSHGAIEWAAEYSWDNTARQTLQVLEKATLS